MRRSSSTTRMCRASSTGLLSGLPRSVNPVTNTLAVFGTDQMIENSAHGGTAIPGSFRNCPADARHLWRHEALAQFLARIGQMQQALAPIRFAFLLKDITLVNQVFQ